MNKIINYIAIFMALALSACSSESITPINADNMDELTLGVPTISIQGVNLEVSVPKRSTFTTKSGDTNPTVNTSSLYVELIDSEGKVLRCKEGKPITSQYTYDGNSWSNQTSNLYTPLYVTNGTGNYRMRAYGKVFSNNMGELGVAYVGVVTVGSNENGSGSFTLVLEPVTSLVRVQIKDANGNQVTSSNTSNTIDQYLVCFNGIANAHNEKIFSTINTATTIADMVPTTPNPTYSFASVAIDNSFVNAFVLPSVTGYPLKWTYNNIVIGSFSVLMTVYKKINLIYTNPSDGKLYTDANYTTPAVAGIDYIEYPVICETGKYRMDAGKCYSFTLMLNGMDMAIESIGIGDFNEEEGDTEISYFIPEDAVLLVVRKENNNITLVGNSTESNNWVVYKDNSGEKVSDDDVCTAVNNALPINGNICLNLMDVTALPIKVFEGKLSIAKVFCPKVTSIGNNAFRSCYNLTSVDLPKVNNIENYVFYNCTNLTSANLPEANSIGNYTFYSCTNLTGIDLPEVNSIRDYTFQNCSNLAMVNIPKVTNIGNNVFWNCTSLTSVDFPKTTSIGDNVFQNCTSLISANLPETTSIGDRAFDSCSKLTTLTFGAISKIGITLFYNSTSFTTNIDLTFKGIPTVGNLNEATMKWADYTFKSITVTP